MIEMSLEAHDFFLKKVEKVDSLERVVVSLEQKVKGMQDSLEQKQKDFIHMLIDSEKIRAELEQARFALDLEVKDLERRVKLLKLSHRQRKALLRQYYPKLTRDQRFTICLVGAFSIGVGLIIGLTY